MADLEQLERLGLDALRHVEDHHRGVGCGQDAVGVLGEVAVAGRVEEVDRAIPVGELEDGGADRDASFLLERHPVGRGPAPACPGPHRTGLLHGTGVQEELLGQGGLAGVGVADDGEGAPVGRLGRWPGRVTFKVEGRSEGSHGGGPAANSTGWASSHRWAGGGGPAGPPQLRPKEVGPL